MIDLLFPKASTGQPVTSSLDLFREVYGGGATAAGVSMTDESAMRVSAVFACVALRAETFAHLPFGVFRKQATGTRDELRDDPLARLMNRPNPWQTRKEFCELISIWRDLRGNFFALKNYIGGTVEELIPVHPQWVQLRLLPGGEVEYVLTPPQNVGLPAATIPRENILHIKGPSRSAWEGMSRLTAAREATGLAIGAERHGAAVFRNGTRLSGILSSDGTVDDEARGRIKKSWEENYSGADQAWKVPILEAGLKFEKVSMTAEDAQWIESRRFQVEEIARIFRCPLHLIGELTKSTSWGSGIEQLSLGYVQFTMTPDIVGIEQRLDAEFLAIPADGRYCKWNVDGLLRGDAKSRAEALRIMRQEGIINADEWRALMDLNPIPDGSGQIYLRMANTTRLDGPDAKPNPADPGQPKEEDKPTAAGDPPDPGDELEEDA